MFKRILLPLDGSTFAEQALPYSVADRVVRGATVPVPLVRAQEKEA